MARPVVGSPKDRQMVIRVDGEMRQRIEALQAALSKRAGDVPLPAAGVVRQLLWRGLESLEKDLKRKG